MVQCTSFRACKIGTLTHTWLSQLTKSWKMLELRSKPLQANGLTIIQIVNQAMSHCLLVKVQKPTLTPFVGIGLTRCCIGSTGTSRAKVGHQPSALKCKTTVEDGGSKQRTLQRIQSTSSSTQQNLTQAVQVWSRQLKQSHSPTGRLSKTPTSQGCLHSILQSHPIRQTVLTPSLR